MLFLNSIKSSLFRQKGMSFSGWLLVIAGVFIVAQLGLKIVPTYMESYAITESLKSLGAQAGIKDKTASEISSQLRKNFVVNNVGHEAVKALKVKRVDQHMHITVDYERRIPVVMNIDIIISFEHFLNTASPDQCCTPK